MSDPTTPAQAVSPGALGGPPPGPAGPGGPMGPAAAVNGWSRWLPMITALAVAVTPIGVATITSQVAMSSTNKDYVGLAISVLNSDKSTPAMRNWATNVLERLAPIPMQGATRRDFVSGGAALSTAPLNCGATAFAAPDAAVGGGTTSPQLAPPVLARRAAGK